MESARIADLLQRYEALATACATFGRTVQADNDLPLLLPTYNQAAGGEREAAARALTRLWHPDIGESLVSAGMLCASTDTLAAAESLNAAKQAFKSAVAAVRDHCLKDKTRLDTLIGRLLKEEGRRNAALKGALAIAHINRLDLVRCYSQVRILPSDLRSISWTWATAHSTIHRVTQAEAVELAQKLNDQDARETALSLLATVSPGDSLAYKKTNANQLRANLVWYDGEVLRRKAITISGIVLSQDPHLPRYVWRDDPAKLTPEQRPDRLPRIDTIIEEHPFIRALYLHRYLGEAHASR